MDNFKLKDIRHAHVIPEHWKWVSISDLGIVTSGGTPSTANPQFWGGEIAWITPADLSGFGEKYIGSGKRTLTDVGLNNSSATLLPAKTVMFSSRAPIGYVAIAKSPIATNQGFKNISLTPYTDEEYIYYYLKSSKQNIEKLASGTTFLELSASAFKRIPIPLPPLEEQRKIVSKLEEIISDIDFNNKIFEGELKRLHVYKQAVLKEMFGGHEFVRLEDLTQLITKGSSPKWQGINYTPDTDQTLFVTSENVKEGFLDLTSPKFVEDIFNGKQKRSILSRGDVLLNIVGASIGRAAIFDGDRSANINQAVALIRPERSLNNKYLMYYLNSLLARSYYQANVVDVARANLSLERIANMPVPFCNIDQQSKIVNEIESKFTNVDYLVETIEQSRSALASYMSGIFRRAFSGRLVQHEVDNKVEENTLLKIKEYIAEMAKKASNKKNSEVQTVHGPKKLLDIVEQTFLGREFHFEELRPVVMMPYQELKDELFALINSHKLSMRFDQIDEKLKYRISQ